MVHPLKSLKYQMMKNEINASNLPGRSLKQFMTIPKALFVLLLLLSAGFFGCKKDTYQGETHGLCPAVLSTDPANYDSMVVTSKKISVVFNEMMNPAGINGTTFTLQNGTILVSGTVSYLGNTATFSPASYLLSNTLYTGTISAGVKDKAGNAMPAAYTWIFRTGTISSNNQPRVVSTDPPNASSSVALNKKIAAVFNTAMNPATINNSSFIISQGRNTITGVVSYSGTTAIFTPSASLPANSSFTGTITTAAKDVSGVAMGANYTWIFSTGAVSDTVKPKVTSTDPANNANGVILNKVIFANFSKSMDPATINATTFKMANASGPVAGTVSYSGATADFNPTGGLTAATTYTATITVGAKDLSANPLASNYSWIFTTGSTSGQPPVNLGSAGAFAILAGSGITNTGQTIINGDAGTSPTGTVNGFPPGVVNGNIHAADPVSAQAKIDLTTAYNDAQGRSTGAINLPGELSGLTLAPGLYSNSSSVMLSAGNVTLDGQGDVNAIFIFKMGSTLTTLAGTGVILAGGAQAKNIFWSVGSSGTLGTNSTFYGNILADQSISLSTGAVLNGRALTRIGAVTLQSNIVTKP
jgi:hypothetical protein